MKSTISPVLSGAWALALATLLVSPSFAEARPRQGTSKGQEPTVSQSGSSARSGGAYAKQRSHRGAPARSARVQRDRGKSSAARSQVTTPRSVQSRQRGSHSAPQQRSWSRPQPEPRQSVSRSPSQVRPTPSRALPRDVGQRARGQVVERQRQDNRNAWRPTPRTQQPADIGRDTSRDTGRFSGRETSRETSRYSGRDTSLNSSRDIATYNDRNRQQDGRYRGQDGGQVGGQYRGRDGGSSYERYDRQYSGHRTQQFEGRVRRLERGDGGYRVWLDHGNHCFWIPEARFRLWPIRIGFSVSFGGFWNPAGYYNIYDYGSYYYGGSHYGGRPYYGSSSYGGSYYGGRSYYGGSYNASSYLQGYVDRFDYAAGTMVVRDDSSGRYATVLMRGDDPQFGYLQPGDWVSLSGVWTRSGYFEAYRIEDLTQR